MLDLCLVAPKKDKARAGKNGHLKRMLSASGSPSTTGTSTPAPLHSHPDGLIPPDADRVEIDEWERKMGRVLTEEDTDEVARMATWCFVRRATAFCVGDGIDSRSNGMIYSTTNVSRRPCQKAPCSCAACWDTPPPTTSSLYPAFKRALKRYLQARQVNVPVLTPAQVKQREEMVKTVRRPPMQQPDCVVGGVSYCMRYVLGRADGQKLMDFQVSLLPSFGWCHAGS